MKNNCVIKNIAFAIKMLTIEINGTLPWCGELYVYREKGWRKWNDLDIPYKLKARINDHSSDSSNLGLFFIRNFSLTDHFSHSYTYQITADQ